MDDEKEEYAMTEAEQKFESFKENYQKRLLL